jgi:hypothetical protein
MVVNSDMKIIIELEVNEAGIPYVERPGRAFLECRVFPPAPERPNAEVDIQGNEEGLRWLGEAALAVANAKPDGYHIHLGQEEGLRGVNLTIGRIIRRR